MSKFVSFASEIRVGALLCSSAAVLLTACGGGSDFGNAGAQPTQTAAVSFNSAAAPAEASLSPANTDAVATTDAAVQGSDAQSADAGPANFDIAGYGDAQADAQSETGTEAAPAAQASAADSATASAAGATRLLAMSKVSVAAVTPATTYNYYVAPTGSDSYAGSKAQPFKTLARAIKAANRASTTVFVAPGTYDGGVLSTANGTASGHIYFVSTTKGAAKVVPPATSRNSTAWDNRGNYVDIIGFDIDGTVSRSGTKWLHGIYNGGSYDTIKDNHVHHIAKVVPCNGAGGAGIGVDSYYHGMKSDVINNVVNDIGPAGCTFQQGIYMSTSGSVKNNLVYRIAEAGIHLWHDATNVIITNNTVTTSHTGIIIGGGDFYYSAGPDDYTAVYNNIVYDNYYGISEQGKTGTHNTYRNNLVYQNSVPWTLKNRLTHTGTVSSAPLFVSYTKTGTPNLHLTSSSPAIGRGTATNAYPTDLDGKPRNASTGYDIGAYQH